MAESPDGFKILGTIRGTELIASGRGVRIAEFLREKYGGTRWRKLKGFALVEEQNGWIGNAEIHWFETHGVGRVNWKIKHRFYD